MAIRKISIGIAVVVVVAGGLLAGAWFTLGGGKPSSPSSQPNDTATKAKNEAPPPDPTKHGYSEISFAKQMIVYNQQAITYCRSRLPQCSSSTTR